MESGKKIIWNVKRGQVIFASGDSTVNAVLNNNGTNVDELENIIEGIRNNMSDLRKEDADKIIDIIEMVKEEFAKPEPRAGRLKSCLSLLAPMISIVNGIPTLTSNLQKLQEFISLHIL